MRQVDADTLEMLRTINAGSLPGVKEVQVSAVIVTFAVLLSTNVSA